MTDASTLATLATPADLRTLANHYDDTTECQPLSEGYRARNLADTMERIAQSAEVRHAIQARRWFVVLAHEASAGYRPTCVLVMTAHLDAMLDALTALLPDLTPP